MANRKYYVICEQNCKFESMTKEQILTAITQAVENGEVKDVDTGFVQTINTINGIGLRFFVGSQAEYESLTAEEKENLFAIITNDTTKEAMLEAIETMQRDFNEVIDGQRAVPSATNAVNAVNAEYAGYAEVAGKASRLDDELEHSYDNMTVGRAKFAENAEVASYAGVAYDLEKSRVSEAINDGTTKSLSKGLYAFDLHLVTAFGGVMNPTVVMRMSNGNGEGGSAVYYNPTYGMFLVSVRVVNNKFSISTWNTGSATTVTASILGYTQITSG